MNDRQWHRPGFVRSSRPRWRRASGIIGSTSLILALAACSSSGKSGGGGAGDGDPLKIGVVYTEGVAGVSQAEPKNAAEAAATYINDHGGIGGRKVALVECNDHADPTANLQCGTQFADQHVLAVTGFTIQWGLNGLTVTSKARIPSFTRGVLPAEFSDPTSFPQGGGAAAEFAALAKYAVTSLHATNVVAFTSANGKSVLDQDVAAILKKNGLTKYTMIAEGGASPDFAPVAQRIVSTHPDVVIAAYSGSDCAKAWTALRQSGYTGPVLSSSACLDLTNAIQPAGTAAKNVGLASALADYDDQSNPDVATFTGAMKAAGKTPSAASQIIFAAMMNIKTLATEAGAKGLTSSAFLSYLQTKVTEYPAFAGTTVKKADAPTALPSLWFTKVDIYTWNGSALTKSTPEPIAGLS